MQLKVLSDLSVVCVQQGIDGGILDVIKETAIEYMERFQEDKVMDPANVQPTCILLDNLH